jgi:hypothetical protein
VNAPPPPLHANRSVSLPVLPLHRACPISAPQALHTNTRERGIKNRSICITFVSKLDTGVAGLHDPTTLRWTQTNTFVSLMCPIWYLVSTSLIVVTQPLGRRAPIIEGRPFSSRPGSQVEQQHLAVNASASPATRKPFRDLCQCSQFHQGHVMSEITPWSLRVLSVFFLGEIWAR